MSVTERGREGEGNTRGSTRIEYMQTQFDGFKFFYKAQKIYKHSILISCLSVIFFIYLHLMRRK